MGGFFLICIRPNQDRLGGAAGVAPGLRRARLCGSGNRRGRRLRLRRLSELREPIGRSCSAIPTAISSLSAAPAWRSRSRRRRGRRACPTAPPRRRRRDDAIDGSLRRRSQPQWPHRDQARPIRRLPSLLQSRRRHRLVVVLRALLGSRRLTLSQQSACEYVFNGVVSGNETLVRRGRAGADRRHDPGRPARVGGRPPDAARSRATLPRRQPRRPRSTAAWRCSTAISAAVARSFGDRVGCALSGGYDSRLMLACLRRHGVRPRVYVYGSARRDGRVPRQRDRPTRRAFHSLSSTRATDPIIPPGEFADTAHRNFLAADGYGYGGIFQNDAEIAESARRVRGNAIAFNGGGGEIFRNFFYLPDREYTIRELLWSFYSQFDPADLYPGLRQRQILRRAREEGHGSLGQRRAAIAAADGRMALSQLSLPRLGRQGRQHRRPIRVHRHALSRARR